MGGAFPNAVAGSTPPASATTSGSPTLVNAAGSGGGTGAYGTIQAESYAALSGTVAEATTDTGGGQDVGYIAGGDWLRYDSVNFGSTAATQFRARAASGIAGGASGLAEVRLDSLTATPVGSFALAKAAAGRPGRPSRPISAPSPAPIPSI
jgi:hypothetical protein